MILVALGANLPGPHHRSPRETLEWATTRLAALPSLELAARSRWFRSPAWPQSNQPDYINAVVHLHGIADPHALLAALQAIEAEAGRTRTTANAARPLDLDLLAIDDRVIDDATLTLPHPRLQERAFVLAPLVDVAPAWRHPILHRTAAELLAALPDADAATPLL